MDEIERLKAEIKILQEIKRIEGTEALLPFIKYTHKDYDTEWFHELICSYLDQLHEGKIKKLMIFVPPQHGKSEISSRRFPAYTLGKNPKTKIAVASYSPELAQQFNRSIQDIIDSDEYSALFPETRLWSTKVKMAMRGNTVRNTTTIETVKYKGFVKTIGIGSALTGTPVDIGIIDDPFKDRESANSLGQRERVWSWYNDVFKTRLHNDSKILMLFTRWHEDDLAGRILDKNNPCYDEEEASQWTVIALPALKEKQDNEFNTVELNDPRQEDEALWEKKHAASKYVARRRMNPTSFASLDQQRPSLIGGNRIKDEWFEIIKPTEMPFNPEHTITNYFIDGAFTDKSENDDTAIMACSFFRGRLYIHNVTAVKKQLYEFLKFLPGYVNANNYRQTSTIYIELKASGYPMLSMLSTPEYGNYNCQGIPEKVVALGKLNRVENSEPFLASGKVVLEQGSWNQSFIAQCGAFPNGQNDDMVDTLTYAIHHHFITGARVFKTTDLKQIDIF